MYSSPKNKGRKQSGYMMVEVMVSAVIVIIGVMGIARLQYTSKTANTQAIERSTASSLSDNLIERIRQNPAGIDTYFPTDAVVTIAGSGTATSTVCSTSVICTADQIADYDIWEWRQSLSGALETVSGTSTGGLVDPRACLLRPAGGGDGIYHIAIAWHGLTPLEEVSGTPTSITNSNAANCGTSVGDNAYDANGSNDNAFRRVHWQQIFLDI